MPRTRLIYPEAPKDEAVASCSIEAQLAWVYLPCHADREGRLADKPFNLRLEIFPTRPVDMDVVLGELAAAQLIRRYTVDGRRYIQIRSFAKYQRPHKNEAPSAIPPAADATPCPVLVVDLSRDEEGPEGSGNVASPPEPSDHYASTPAVSDPVPDPESVRDPVRASERARDPVALQRPEARAWAPQRLLDLFGRVRSEVLGGLDWAPAGSGIQERAREATLKLEGQPELAALVEPSMRLHLQRMKGNPNPKYREGTYAFGAWAARLGDLLEELTGRTAEAEAKPCAFHAKREQQERPAPKHLWRPDCPRCQNHPQPARAGPFAGTPATAAGASASEGR